MLLYILLDYSTTLTHKFTLLKETNLIAESK